MHYVEPYGYDICYVHFLSEAVKIVFQTVNYFLFYLSNHAETLLVQIFQKDNIFQNDNIVWYADAAILTEIIW